MFYNYCFTNYNEKENRIYEGIKGETG